METKGIVSCIAQDEFGKKIVLGEKNGVIEIFYRDESEHAQKRFEVKGHEGSIWSISFLPSSHGSSFLSGGYDGFLKLWRITSNGTSLECVAAEDLHSSINSIDTFSVLINNTTYCLAVCALSNGYIAVRQANTLCDTIIENEGENTQPIPLHPTGCTAVAAPRKVTCLSISTTQQTPQYVYLLSGGVDGTLALSRLALVAAPAHPPQQQRRGSQSAAARGMHSPLTGLSPYDALTDTDEELGRVFDLQPVGEVVAHASAIEHIALTRYIRPEPHSLGTDPDRLRAGKRARSEDWTIRFATAGADGEVKVWTQKTGLAALAVGDRTKGAEAGRIRLNDVEAKTEEPDADDDERTDPRAPPLDLTQFEQATVQVGAPAFSLSFVNPSVLLVSSGTSTQTIYMEKKGGEGSEGEAEEGQSWIKAKELPLKSVEELQKKMKAAPKEGSDSDLFDF